MATLWKVCLAVLMLAQANLALAASITAELTPTDGTLGDPFVLTLVIEGSNRSDPVIPNVEGLQFQQRGVSQSMSIVNGSMTSQLQLTVLVVPDRPGDFTIPSITATIDNQKVATVPLKLKVRPAGTTAQSAAPQQQTPQGRAAAQQPRGAAAADGGPGANTAGVFLERECEGGPVYVGQQMLCTIRLYHRGNLNGGQRLSQSSADFRRFSLEGEKRYQKVVSGQRYSVIELKELIVPTKAGNLELPPFGIEARVLVWNKQNNPLDKFFDKFGGGVFDFDLNFTEERAVTVNTEPQRIDVKPLPSEGRPSGFNGLVGLFQLESNLSKNKIAAGDTVTITITIQGYGVTDTLGDIAPPLQQIGKVYPDKPEYTEQVTAERGIVSKKVYKYALVPTKPGTYSLGAVELPAFNPKLNQYVLLKADLGNLIVDPGQVESQQQSASSVGIPAAKEDVKVLGNDLLGLHRNSDLSTQQTITSNEKSFLALVGGAPFLSFLCSLGLFLYRNRSTDPELHRRSLAYRTYRQRLNLAQQALANGDVAGALSEAHKSLRDYLGDRLSVQGGALTARDIDTATQRLGAGDGLKQTLAQLVGQFDLLEFGGQIPGPEQAGEILTTLDQVVRGLEKA